MQIFFSSSLMDSITDLLRKRILSRNDIREFFIFERTPVTKCTPGSDCCCFFSFMMSFLKYHFLQFLYHFSGVKQNLPVYLCTC